MLVELRIRGLGVIDEAALPLHRGLTVVTGETGAGKTMVIEGLSLLVGGRLDSGIVRAGSDRAGVEGRVLVNTAVADIAEELGGVVEDGELLVTRTVTGDGRSRCQVGGVSVPVATLAAIGDETVALHGQHDQQRLVRPDAQRSLLDRFGGAAIGDVLVGYRRSYDAWRDTERELSEVTAHREERAAEAARLQDGVTAIEALAPVAGEDAELTSEIARLGHADALRRASELARDALSADTDAPDADALVQSALRELRAVDGVDARLDAVATRLLDAHELLSTAASDLARYAADLEDDPVRLADAQERVAALTALSRRFDADAAGLLAWAEDARLRLDEVGDDLNRVTALAERRDALAAEVVARALELTAARTETAALLSTSVTDELGALALPSAQFTVSIEASSAPGPDGADAVTMLLTPHPGAPARPVAKGASGGELSRVMLALEVVLAAADPLPTMVFDEVDAGVGGRAAVEIGRRLARLARSHQVVVVTHLPQVAAFADAHLRVEKSGDGRVTRSDVVLLDDAERIVELSRMLAGLDGSELARGHAEELLAAAADAKLAG